MLPGRAWLRSDVPRLGWLGVRCMLTHFSAAGNRPLASSPCETGSCTLLLLYHCRASSESFALRGCRWRAACMCPHELLRRNLYRHKTRLAAQHSGGTQHATAPARTLCQTEHSHLPRFGIRTAVLGCVVRRDVITIRYDTIRQRRAACTGPGSWYPGPDTVVHGSLTHTLSRLGKV